MAGAIFKVSVLAGGSVFWMEMRHPGATVGPVPVAGCCEADGVILAYDRAANQLRKA